MNPLTQLTESIRKLDLEEVSTLAKKLLDLDLGHVSSSLTSQSYSFFFFSTALARIKKDYNDCQIDLDKTSFRVRTEESERLETLRKKVTEKYLDSYVLAHPDVVNIRTRLNDLDCQYEFCKALTRALEQRKDMLVQMSANNRAEMKLN